MNSKRRGQRSSLGTGWRGAAACAAGLLACSSGVLAREGPPPLLDQPQTSALAYTLHEAQTGGRHLLQSAVPGAAGALQGGSSSDLTQAQIQYLSSKQAGQEGHAAETGPGVTSEGLGTRAAGPSAALSGQGLGATARAEADRSGAYPGATQAANNVNVQRAILNSQGDTSQKTFAQVNAAAPTIKYPNTNTAVKPVASSAREKSLTTSEGLGNPQSFAGDTSITSTQSYAGDIVQGSTIGTLFGVRISTPTFGSGFNVCIDRYFGSFPVVGIVVPNSLTWLLPQLGDAVQQLRTSIDIPTVLTNGARTQPTSDGFLINFPTAFGNLQVEGWTKAFRRTPDLLWMT